MPEPTQRSRSPRSRSGQPRTSQPRAAQPGARSRAGRPRTDPARRAAYDVLRAVADRDAYANLLLPALLSERGLTGRDAAFATELTYGTLRGRGTYDAILAACSDRDELDPPVRDVLRLGAHQLLATRVGHHAAVATSGDLAVRHSYPRWIVDAFRDALGPAAAETEDALAAGNVRPEVVLALSPAPATSPADLPVSAPDDLLPDGERTRWSPYGYRLAGGDPAPLVASGQAAVQDEASQLAALALTRIGLDPGTGQDRLWLDLCAGPGGKARLLSGLAAARGARLVASDIRPHRAQRVLEALRRAGGEDPAVLAADGRQVPWPPGTFDRVLADVPCSGLGSLRRRPEARWRKTPADVAELAGLQRELLNAAIDSVRPGGVVAYVTCSPHLAETRDVVTAVARSRDDIAILDAPAVLPEVPALRAPEPENSKFAQFWPHRHGTDAIFLALLRRG